MNKTQISPYGKVKVYWNDKPENYSKASKLAIRNDFAKKYGVDKDKIDVLYRAVKIDNQGNVIKLDGVQVENIGDIPYQRKLFKEWIDRNDKVVNFDRLMKLDDKVNASLDADIVASNGKKWEFEWIMIDNMLAFGDNNYFPVDRYEGLVVISSNPANQGGKTTLVIDAFKFLLYGVTTKTAKNEQIFNRYRDKDTVTVRGLLRIDGEKDFIIERTLTRKAKKDDTWAVSSVLKYYWLLPDGEESDMEEADATQTTKKIRETVGDVKDFDLVSLATGDNLSSLVGNSVGENGKIFTRLIGLEVMELKEAIVRKMYTDYGKTMLTNNHSKVELEDEIVQSESSQELAELKLTQAEDKLVELATEITKMDGKRTELLSSKAPIDNKLTITNLDVLEQEILNITNTGIKHKATLTELETSYNEVKDVDYDEYKEKRVTDRVNEINTEVALKNAEVLRLGTEITRIEQSEICITCNRPLDDVDNTDTIAAINVTITTHIAAIKGLESELAKLETEVSGFKTLKADLDRKQRIEIEIERVKLRMDTLRNQLSNVKDTKKEFELNSKAIERNKEIDNEVNLLTSQLQVLRNSKDNVIKVIELAKGEVDKHKTSIEVNKGLLIKMGKEAEVERMYKLYIEMVGKKGVSKIILRSVIPIINSELDRLLEGVCDFEVEVRIDDKNDVNLMIIKDGVEGLLKSTSGLEKTVSAVALRCVLGVVSTLPMPNFIVFDEVLDKIAMVNIPLMKPLFDKVADSYDKLFLITHNEMAKDWSNKIITVNKEGNISTISCK